MKANITTFGIWVRRVRRWRRWLRRDAWQSALILLLALSLAEPLVCLIHCRFMALDTAYASAAHSHQHAPALSTPGDAFVSSADHMQHLYLATQQPGAAAFLGLALSDCPFLSAASGSLPLSLASEASPLHEHLAAISLLALLMLMLPLLFSFPKLVSAPPQTLTARMLRPPISTLV